MRFFFISMVVYYTGTKENLRGIWDMSYLTPVFCTSPAGKAKVFCHTVHDCTLPLSFDPGCIPCWSSCRDLSINCTQVERGLRTLAGHLSQCNVIFFYSYVSIDVSLYLLSHTVTQLHTPCCPPPPYKCLLVIGDPLEDSPWSLGGGGGDFFGSNSSTSNK
jgi:hypothetical protein